MQVLSVLNALLLARGVAALGLLEHTVGRRTPASLTPASVVGPRSTLADIVSTSSCSTRDLSGAALGNGVYDGVWRADHATQAHCNTTGGLLVGCGELVHTTLTRCTSSDASAGTATASVLLGPFNSTGGYDWWQIYTREEPTYFDSAMTSLASFSLTLHDADATSPATALLGLPPIHMHHSSWNGALGGGWTLQGDTECAGEVVGTPCYTHDLLSRGYGLPGNYSTLGFGGVYNDVRFRGADTAGQPVPTLRWYLNLTVTVVDPSVTLARELLSLTFRNFYPVRTGNWFQTVYVPAEAHSFVAMETRWPTSGRLLTDPSLSRFHGHQGSHLYSFLIASSVANLGMNQTKFLSSTGCEPVATSR